MDWRPENKKLTKIEEISYQKKLLLGINKKSVGTKKPNKIKIISDKIDYFISISQLVIMAIDHSTLDDK